MANVKTIQVIINDEEQHQLWQEVGEYAKEIGWGKDWWEFAGDGEEEFILIRKSDIIKSG